ncbi:DUF4336 domain-containing protein [Pseudorhodobacter sp. E13]|uniref:DUF4336 domain-containing protein n=1 Tax=Pseudorhodobacter sp. E13 TaxID=2487931 RepID=UPI000F8F2702|nr:DUF4336 domain-containing protein [Pseudorhodobacter sp. E13]RUS63371.1 DUF4336 domain-containing protein [Pseudorhodobacter sp. E13]
MLTKFGPEIWLAEGPKLTAALGFCYPTRMAVIRLPQGGLFIWSPVALSDGLAAALSALGPLQHVVAPNALHDSFLTEWRTAYPGAAFHAAPKLSQARPDIPFATELTDAPLADWQGALDQVVFWGNAITTEVVFFHRASGTAIFTDLLQQLPRDWFSGWRRLVARLDLMTEASPAVPRKFRLAFRDRPAARKAAAQVLAWQPERLIIAHGPPLQTGATPVLRQAFRWLGAGLA